MGVPVRLVVLVRLRYHSACLRRERLLAPLAVWLVAAAVVGLLARDPAVRAVTEGCLTLVPLLTAVLAPGVLLDDPARETLLATPHRASWLVLERVAGLLGLGTVLSAALWGWAALLGVKGLPPWWSGFGATSALTALSLAVAHVCAEGVAGAVAGGAVWFLALFVREAAATSRAVAAVYPFLAVFDPRNPALGLNWAVMLGAAAALFAASGALAEAKERYL